NGAPTCGQLTADNCAKHNGTSLGAISCSHNPCLSSSTTTSTTGAATTTTSSAAPTTTTSSAAPTTTTSSAAATTTTSSAASTTTSSTTSSTSSTTSTTTSSTTSSTSSTTSTTTSSTTTTTTSLAPCAPIVTGQGISGTYQTTSLGPTDAAAVKVCTTNSTTNRFAICTDDTFCGGAAGSGLCAQTPWVDAGGVTQPTPTATTTFTVTAGSPPTCEHTVCIQCGAIDKCADIQGGCDNCGGTGYAGADQGHEGERGVRRERHPDPHVDPGAGDHLERRPGLSVECHLRWWREPGEPAHAGRRADDGGYDGSVRGAERRHLQARGSRLHQPRRPPGRPAHRGVADPGPDAVRRGCVPERGDERGLLGRLAALRPGLRGDHADRRTHVPGGAASLHVLHGAEMPGVRR